MTRRTLGWAPSERGFTSTELVVGIALMFVVTAGALGFLESASRIVRVSTSETESLDQARVAMARMAHEVRSALAVHAASAQCPLSTCLTLTVQRGAGTTEVRYRYSGTSLFRAEGDIFTNVWGGEAPVASHVRNGAVPVFSRNTGGTIGNEAAIKVTLAVNTEPSRPAQTIRIASTLTPRNL